MPFVSELKLTFSCMCCSEQTNARIFGQLLALLSPPWNSVDLFICHNAVRCRGTWQRPHCDLLWTNDGAKRLICHSQRIKSRRAGQSLPKSGDKISSTFTCNFSLMLSFFFILGYICFVMGYLTLLQCLISDAGLTGEELVQCNQIIKF